MISLPARPSSVSLPPPPRRMSPSPQTGPVSGQLPEADRAATAAAVALPLRRPAAGCADSPLIRASAGLVDRVASGEAAGASVDQPRGGQHAVGALDAVVERTTGVGLGLLPAVAVDHELDRQAAEVVVDHHVVVGGDGVVLVDRPVEATGAGVAVDRGVLRHDVVATFGVVVVLTDLTDEDVVARSGLGRVVEERRTVVALEQVLPGATLDPVVATVAEHRVGTLAGDDEVVAGTGERLVVVGAAVDEVLALVAHDDVVCRDRRRWRRCRARPWARRRRRGR